MVYTPIFEILSLKIERISGTVFPPFLSKTVGDEKMSNLLKLGGVLGVGLLDVRLL